MNADMTPRNSAYWIPVKKERLHPEITNAITFGVNGAVAETLKMPKIP